MTAAVRKCVEPHLYGPAVRSTWEAWAAELLKTHRQLDCPDCRLPVIWRPRDQHTPDEQQLDLFGTEALNP